MIFKIFNTIGFLKDTIRQTPEISFIIFVAGFVAIIWTKNFGLVVNPKILCFMFFTFFLGISMFFNNGSLSVTQQKIINGGVYKSKIFLKHVLFTILVSLIVLSCLWFKSVVDKNYVIDFTNYFFLIFLVLSSKIIYLLVFLTKNMPEHIVHQLFFKFSLIVLLYSSQTDLLNFPKNFLFALPVLFMLLTILLPKIYGISLVRFAPYNISAFSLGLVFVVSSILGFYTNSNFAYVSYIVVAGLETMWRSINNSHLWVRESSEILKMIIVNYFFYILVLVSVNTIFPFDDFDLLHATFAYCGVVFVYKYFQNNYMVAAILSAIFLSVFANFEERNIEFLPQLYFVVICACVLILLNFGFKNFCFLALKSAVFLSIFLFLEDKTVFLFIWFSAIIHEVLHVLFYRIFFSFKPVFVNLFSFNLSVHFSYKTLIGINNRHTSLFFLAPSLLIVLAGFVVSFSNIVYAGVLFFQVVNLIPFRGSDMHGFLKLRNAK